MTTFKEWLLLRESNTGQQSRLALAKIRGEKTLKIPQNLDRPDLTMSKK